MTKRILSTVIILALLALAIYFGGACGFSALILILALLAAYEACQLEKKCGLNPRFWLVALLLCAFFASPFLCRLPYAGCLSAALLSPQIVLVGFLIAALKSPYSDYPLKTLLPEYLTAVVFGTFILCFVRLAFIDIKIAVWAAFVIKFSDIGGYLFGCGFGRNKIAPTISPKKSWEGLLGGIFLSSAGG
ncbi:MAG: phosphatidate cytidylyltransferase, partial [Opitutales bacterium]|nr:phosphatidate cytidylyltransferase [Opitutales bacterium]